MATVVGSGIAAGRMSPDDAGLQLLEVAAVTGASLAVLIAVLGPVSGAHLNPVVTLAARALGAIDTRETLAYGVAQVLGAAAGAVLANLMFSLPAVELASRARGGSGLLLGEAVATSGLVLVVLGLLRAGRSSAVAASVGAYIAAAHFFTSSTAFANPAVTVGRSLSDTFAGIAPASLPAFVAVQLVGAAVGVVLVLVLYPRESLPAPAPASRGV